MAVIGAGAVGCAVARELSRTAADCIVLERASDVGEGSSKANSGIVHAGFQPRGGSLKGVSCVRGNEMLRSIAEKLDVPLVPCGGVMVAFDDAGVEKLREKMARGVANGAPGLRIADGDEARSLEPRLSGRVVAALMAPSTAIVSPFAYVVALAENAAENGVCFQFGATVERVERACGAWRLCLADGSRVDARYVVNAAGDEAALIDAQVHPADLVVRPRLGDYLVFDKQDPARAITHVIYQAAETDEGGTLLAPTVDGNLLAGPTSRNVRDFASAPTSAAGLAHVERVARKLIPDLDMGLVIRNFAGVRTNIVNVSKELKDFVVRPSAEGFVSILGIKNPGLTSSPYLARCAVEALVEAGLDARERPAFVPRRKRYVPFLERDGREQAALLAADASYGRVVCRCEGITEGDVRAVLAGPLPPSSLSGVKRRLRCGMGRCQGQFCEPKVCAAAAEAWGVGADRVPAGEHGGRLVAREVK